MSMAGSGHLCGLLVGAVRACLGRLRLASCFARLTATLFSLARPACSCRVAGSLGVCGIVARRGLPRAGGGGEYEYVDFVDVLPIG